MKDTDFGLTVIEGNNGAESVNIIFTIIKRSSLPLMISPIRRFNPKAFYSVEDVRFVANTILPTNSFWPRFKFSSMKNPRKAK